MLRIAKVPGKGRGVFTDKRISSGTLIESCPVLVVRHKEVNRAEDPFWQFVFAWGSQDRDWGLALGFGSLYNHSYQPNAQSIRKLKEGVLEFWALTDIAKGQEITINYNGEGSTDKVWFKVK